MNKTLYGILSLAILLTLSSCEHKKLVREYDGTVGVRVVFDWRYAPEASPASMNLFLYSSEGSEFLQYEMAGYTGGNIRVCIGIYDALCLNSDTENIIYRNTDACETFEITTRETSLLGSLSNLYSSSVPRAKGSEDERVAFSPDPIYSGTRYGIPLGVRDEDTTIVLYPKDVLCHCFVEIVNASNLRYANSLSASLSGMAGGLLPANLEPTFERVTIPFGLKTEYDNSSITGDITGTATGDFLTFGYNRNPEVKQQLVVYAIMMDGSKLYYTYDVTEQVHSSPNPYYIHIIVNGLPLPKPVIDGGFQPEVDIWESITVNIPM